MNRILPMVATQSTIVNKAGVYTHTHYHLHAMTYIELCWNLLNTYCKNVTFIPHSCSKALKLQLQVTLYTLMLIVTRMPMATAQSLQLVYFGRFGNHPGANRIFLECQRNSVAVPNPQIFVERSDLARRPVTIAGNQNGRVTIVINQDLEGSYSCSDSGDSSTNTLALVGKESCHQVHELVRINGIMMNLSPIFFSAAYPRPNPLISLFYPFQAGLPATVNCRVKPGKLSRYYSVMWWNGSSTIATSGSVLPRYQLHDNFSLTIKDAQPSDSSTNYRCSVTIDDPRRPGTANVVYNQNQLPHINVMVYGKSPVIHIVSIA